MIGSALRALHDWVVREGTAPERAVRPELRRLPAGAVVGFDVEARARITCLGGELWVTGPNTGDQVLTSGQSLAVVGNGRLVAEALRAARFVVAH